jgi:heme oxygenase
MSPDDEIPIPTSLPTPSHQRSLPDQINTATRSIHSQLNRLITARLPLALPPYSSDPSAYVAGIFHVAPVYITFESLWQSIIDAPHLPTTLDDALAADACDPGSLLLDSHSTPILSNDTQPPLVHEPNACSRTHTLLAHLHLPGLLRTARLRADIRDLMDAPEYQVDDQLSTVSSSGKVAEFTAHIKSSVESNPHVLLAYTWVLYMALFAGGRFLRASLSSAGSEFWSTVPPTPSFLSNTKRQTSTKNHGASEPYDRDDATAHVVSRKVSRVESSVTEVISGLQFFHFQGDEDGVDIKLEFKKRIAEIEVLLTHGEKEDIVREAQEIFRFMIELVLELDDVCGMTDPDMQSSKIESRHSDEPHEGKHEGAVKRSRDSVHVTHDRLLRKREKVRREETDPTRTDNAQEDLLTAKVVHFSDTHTLKRGFEWLARPLGRRFSKAENVEDVNDRRISIVERVVFGDIGMKTTLLILLATITAWFMFR